MPQIMQPDRWQARQIGQPQELIGHMLRMQPVPLENRASVL
jgi:hypothetical protein